MKHHKVDSSNIESVGYDPKESALHVRFKSGNTYKYVGVTHDEMADFANAPSKGKHLNQFIIGKYSGVKL